MALACELPNAAIVATDVSARALGVARRNAARHGVGSRIEFHQGNLLEGVQDAFDLIVSNPPYLGHSEAESLSREVRDHEPAAALFGGPQGCEIYSSLIRQAAKLLMRGGILVIEMGYNGLSEVRPLLEADTRWEKISMTTDLAGIPRVLAAERNEQEPVHGHRL